MKSVVLLLLVVLVICTDNAQAKRQRGGQRGKTSEVDSDCLKFFRAVNQQKNKLLNGNKDLLERFSDGLCMKFPALNCTAYKDKIAPALTTANFNARKVCKFLSPGFRRFKQLDTEASPVICTGCKTVVNFVKFALNVLNQTSEEVKNEIQRMCDMLAPLKIQKQLCDDITNYIEEIIIQEILNGMTPGDICVKLKLCNATAGFIEKIQWGLSKGLGKLAHGYGRLSIQKVKEAANNMREAMKKMTATSLPWEQLHSRRHRLFDWKKMMPTAPPFWRRFSNRQAQLRHLFPHRYRGSFMRRFLQRHRGPFMRRFLQRHGNAFMRRFPNRRVPFMRYFPKWAPTKRPGFPQKWKSIFAKKFRQHMEYFKNKMATQQPQPQGSETGKIPATQANPSTQPPVVISEEDEAEDKLQVAGKEIEQPEVIPEEEQEEVEEPNILQPDPEKNIVVDTATSLPAFDDPFGGFWSNLEESVDDFQDELSPEDLSPEDLSPEDFDDGTTPSSMEDLYNPSEFGKSDFIQSLFKGDDDDDEEQDGDEEYSTSESEFGGFLPKLKLPSLPKSFLKNLDAIMKNTQEQLMKIEEVSKNISFTTTTFTNNNDIGCTVCKSVVEFITWEVKTVNASIETIEKEVKLLCQLYPLKAATEACLKIIDEVDQIVQLIEKDVEPGDICKQIKLCPSESTTTADARNTFSVVSPASQCEPMCEFWKSMHENEIEMTMALWVQAKERLVDMCDKSQFTTKCYKMLRTFEKAEQQLGGVLTRNQQPTTPNTAPCKCFRNQPIFMTKQFDQCQLCKHMETGLKKDVMDAKKSMEFLIQKMRIFCVGVPEGGAKCMQIVLAFNSSFGQLEKKLEAAQDLCSTVGYCHGEVTNQNKEWMKQIMSHVSNKFDSIIPALSNLKSPSGCSFCKECIVNIETTLKHTNVTSIEKITPALKDGFAIFCNSQKTGDEVVQVCKQIYNGMETIQKTMTTIKTEDAGKPSVMCKDLGMC